MNYPADRVFVAGHRPRVTCVTKPPFSPLPETRINFHTCRDDRAPSRLRNPSALRGGDSINAEPFRIRRTRDFVPRFSRENGQSVFRGLSALRIVWLTFDKLNDRMISSKYGGIILKYERIGRFNCISKE